jgi:hypothetical protein
MAKKVFEKYALMMMTEMLPETSVTRLIAREDFIKYA